MDAQGQSLSGAPMHATEAKRCPDVRDAPAGIGLAKKKSETTRTNPDDGLVAEACGVGVPLPWSDFVAAKVSK